MRAERLDAAVLETRALLAREELPDELERALQEGARRARGAEALRGQGLSPRRIGRALAPEPLPVRTLEEGGEDRDQREFIALAITLLLYGQLLTYGFWVAMGVVEEKSSRVVEILLSAIRPRQLLAGKLLGLGVLGLVQLLLVVAIGVALALATGRSSSRATWRARWGSCCCGSRSATRCMPPSSPRPVRSSRARRTCRARPPR